MAQQARAAARRTRRGSVSPWVQILKGLGVAVVVTLGGVALFALLMQWIKPSEGVVRAFNQVLKLASIAAGVWTAVGRGNEGGLSRGVLVGGAYMALGVALYALLSGQQAPPTSYLADLGMGVAGGGIVGLLAGRA